MFKRIRAWLASVVRDELKVSESYLTKIVVTLSANTTKEIDARIKAAVASAVREIQQHTDETVSRAIAHTEETAHKTRAHISGDARAIIEFKRSVRMSCSYCGRYGWNYTIDQPSGTVKCSTCAQKGL